MHLMTMIDPVSCWFEVASICGEPNSLECQMILDSVWLSRGIPDLRRLAVMMEMNSTQGI